MTRPRVDRASDCAHKEFCEQHCPFASLCRVAAENVKTQRAMSADFLYHDVGPESVKRDGEEFLSGPEKKNSD